MNVNLSSNLIAKYNETRIDVDEVKQRISEHNPETAKKNDEVCISEEGKLALEEKMAETRDAVLPHIQGKISNIRRQYYVDKFGEKLIATEKSKDMDAYFQKMKTMHEEMQDEIERKYENSKQEDVYFISQNGVIEELTKDKEMELLNFAYDSHKSLVLNSMKIWEKGL